MEPESNPEEPAALLADPYNRALLTTLEDAGRPLDVTDLAERLVRRDVPVLGADEYEERVERAMLALHHGRLPKLADAGLIEYDHESNVATVRAPRPDVDWQEGATVDDLASLLRADDGPEGGAIGFLEGRESAIQHGRTLADEAEEELFCMYVDTDLLEDECIRRAADALDRGVEMFVGSQNPSVRDLTREQLPDATIWEPQFDWMNHPSFPRIGRLVLADRRKVMLAVLEEPKPDGTYPDETAVVGTGENNPLVVLVRELMGPRLDHLDYQSADFRSELSP